MRNTPEQAFAKARSAGSLGNPFFEPWLQEVRFALMARCRGKALSKALFSSERLISFGVFLDVENAKRKQPDKFAPLRSILWTS